MGQHHKRIISLTVILFFTWLTFTINISLPQRAYAEGLAISGLQCKTTEFKPYHEKGQFAYFLNQPASVTAEIQDNDFNLIRKLQFMKMEEAGENIIMWDGKDEKGGFIKDGEYFLSVNAMGGEAITVASSIGMKMSFDAPKGTAFKGSVSQLEGRQKKEYPITTPEKMRVASCLAPVGSCLGGLGLVALGINLIKKGANKNKKEREEGEDEPTAGDGEINVGVISFVGAGYLGYLVCKDLFTAIIDIKNKNTKKKNHVIYYEDDYDKLADIKRGVDKHNARIDEEIANENRKIDAYNQKIKNSITIRISLTD